MKAPWDQLKKRLGSKLFPSESPFENLKGEKTKEARENIFRELQNPFVVEQYPWATQSTGWYNAWESTPSPWVVAAQTTQDIVEAINFARKHHIRLAVKATGHDYLGRSSAKDSLLIWLYPMRKVEIASAFTPKGAPKNTPSIPAVHVEGGARWIEAYHEVTTINQRYVQGGGCTTVGVCGGFMQGGGYGHFSKKYGNASAGLLEAEVVLASGEVIIANRYQNEDLFWALKGGGGGTWGIVTRVTLMTHPLPDFFGFLDGEIIAHDDEAYEKLISQFITFYRQSLFNEHWGEQVAFNPENRLKILLLFQGLTEKQVQEIWSPFLRWIKENPADYTLQIDHYTIPAKHFWDYNYLKEKIPNYVTLFLNEERKPFYWWTSNQKEVLAYWFTYSSRWLPASLFREEDHKQLTELLYTISRTASFEIHFNKGLAGGSEEARARNLTTAIHPAAQSAAGLVIFAAKQNQKAPFIEEATPDIEKGLKHLALVRKAYQILEKATPGSGTYFTESDYFDENWKENNWGENYPRLLEIKKKYDPNNLFRVHHGVGSDL